MADSDDIELNINTRGRGIIVRITMAIVEVLAEALINVVADAVRVVVLDTAKDIAEDASKALWRKWSHRRRRGAGKPAKGRAGRPRHPFKVITGRTRQAGGEIGRRVKAQYVTYVGRAAGRRLKNYARRMEAQAQQQQQEEPRLALESAVGQAQGRGPWKRRL